MMSAPALVKRELLTSLRRRRTYALLVVATGIVFIMVAFALMMGGVEIAVQAQVAQAVFTFFLIVLFGVGIVFVPLLAGSAIGVEHQQDTLDMLSVTLIRPSGILLGKLINVMGVYLLIAIAAMPVVGVLFFFAGVDLRVFVLRFGWTFLRIASLACAGLLFSSCFPRHPIIAIGCTYLAAPFMVSRMGSLLGVSCLYGALARMRHVSEPPRREATKLIKDPHQLEARRQQWPFYLIDPLRPLKPIPDGSNPMFVKEGRTGPFRQGAWRIRVLYGCIIVFMIFSFGMLGDPHAAWTSFSNVLTVLRLETLLILLLTPAVISASFAKECETGNLDMLRMTTLRPGQIVLGKYFSGAFLLAPFVGASMAGMIFALTKEFRTTETFNSLALGYATMIVSVFVALSVSTAVSLACRRTTVALITGYLVNIALFLVIPFAVFNVLPVVNIHLRSLQGQPNYDVLRNFVALYPTPMTLVVHGVNEPVSLEKTGLCWLNLGICAVFASALLAACVKFFARFRMQERNRSFSRKTPTEGICA